MFDFLHRNKEGENQSIIELITINATKAALSDMAIEKAIGMIAKAIAKSEFIVLRDNKRVKDDVYWMLNVRPNPNETATEFWISTVRKMFTEKECLIIYQNGNLFRAKRYDDDDAVLKGRCYKNITIEANDDDATITKTFKADDVIFLRNTNKKIIKYLKKNLQIYNDIASGLATSKKIASTPKFTLDVEGAAPILKQKNPDGTEKTLTIDEYKKAIKELLSSEDIEVLTNQSGLKVNQMQISTNITAEDIAKMTKEAFTECAYAFDIPRAVFLGEITEKADSTNEFITYAVNWIVKMINDSVNAALVGKDAYLNKGEKIWLDMSKYKHVDIIESAANLEKLRGIGYNLDEIREFTGQEALETEFSKERVYTKNFGNESGGDKDA